MKAFNKLEDKLMKAIEQFLSELRHEKDLGDKIRYSAEYISTALLFRVTLYSGNVMSDTESITRKMVERDISFVKMLLRLVLDQLRNKVFRAVTRGEFVCE